MSIRDLNPLINSAGEALLDRLTQSAHAPIFNHRAGDRIEERDLVELVNFRDQLVRHRRLQGVASLVASSDSAAISVPPSSILERVEHWLKVVPLFADRKGHQSVADWQSIPTMSRFEVATQPQYLVPDDADLERLIIFRTAGTTGHPLLVPHHPVASASYQVMIEAALNEIGVKPDFRAGGTAAFLIGAQKSTVTYPTLLSYWNQAGFVKINLNPDDWKKPTDRQGYFEEFQPLILTGDPISLSTLSSIETTYRPQAMISTAVAMSSSLKSDLEARFGAPVVDWYSLTETGPIGFYKPGDDGYTLLAHDLFVEVIDETGRQVPEGELGEITVTGGRNPFVPLLRYRTGDYGRKVGSKLLDLEGRKPVVFKSAKSNRINAVDVGRVLREYPLVQHHFEQRADLTCVVTVRPFANGGLFPGERLATELRALFEGAQVEVVIDAELGDRIPSGKVIPYKSEVRFEE